MTTKDMVEDLWNAYNLLRTIPVVDGHVDTMYQAKNLISGVHQELVNIYQSAEKEVMNDAK